MGDLQPNSTDYFFSVNIAAPKGEYLKHHDKTGRPRAVRELRAGLAFQKSFFVKDLEVEARRPEAIHRRTKAEELLQHN